VILVDTSVWIDHIRRRDDVLASLAERRGVLVHPFVIGEVALGHLRTRDALLLELHRLPQSVVAANQEVLHLIARQRLFRLGIGYVDAHLLAAVSLTVDGTLWTSDKRLHEAAAKLGVAYIPSC
jgi:predicted nucleic acid-binding protein